MPSPPKKKLNKSMKIFDAEEKAKNPRIREQMAAADQGGLK